jgi:uncharacterized protein
MNPVRFLVLLLTEDCNLSCKYCYLKGGEGRKGMGFEVASRALDIFANQEGGLTVELSGGEPLLRFDLIKQIIAYAEEKGCRLRFAIQTNATLLDKEKIGFIKARRLGLGISMDGIPGVNDLMRGESEKVVHGLRLLDELGMGTNITTVISKESVEHLAEFILFCGSFRSIRVINLDIIRPTGRAEGKDLIPSSKSLSKGINDMLETLDFVNKRRSLPIKIREMDQYFKRRWKEEIEPYCFAAEGKAAVVTPGGDIYPCSSLMDEKFKAGNIFNHDQGRLYFYKPDGGRFAHCGNCEIKSICRGGCPSRRFAFHKHFDQRCELECLLRKEIFHNIR